MADNSDFDARPKESAFFKMLEDETRRRPDPEHAFLQQREKLLLQKSIESDADLFEKLLALWRDTDNGIELFYGMRIHPDGSRSLYWAMNAQDQSWDVDHADPRECIKLAFARMVELMDVEP